MSKNFKQPCLQTTVASDIAPRHQFTHSSNTSTHTRQIMTTIELEPTKTMAPLIEIDSESFPPYEFPVTVELDLPAGIEVLTKAQCYVNLVWIMF